MATAKMIWSRDTNSLNLGVDFATGGYDTEVGRTQLAIEVRYNNSGNTAQIQVDNSNTDATAVDVFMTIRATRTNTAV